MEQTHPLADLQECFPAHDRGLGRSPKTLAHYHDTFTAFYRHLKEAGREPDSGCLTTEGMQTFAAWLRATPTRGFRGTTERSVHGVHGFLKDMRAFVRWLGDEGHLERVVKVPLPKLPQRLFPILSDADVELIWQSRHLTATGDQGRRNRALMALMFDTGIRLTEAATITVADVDLANYGVLINGKGNKQRRVPYSHGVAVLLSDWLKVRGDDPGALFWLKRAGIRMVFERIKRETGVPLFHPHQVRHTACTQMVRSNMDLHSVKR